jgi:hypothetical protein
VSDKCLPRDGERFLTREAHGLRCAVEHASAVDNDIDKVCRFCPRITGEPPPQGTPSPLPFRPKGMHERTYSRLSVQLMIAKDRAFSHLAAPLDKLRVRNWRRTSYSSEPITASLTFS